MSSGAFNKFIQHVRGDEALQQELRAAGERASEPVEAIVAFARGKGYEISADDLNGELTEAELEGASGGFASTYSTTSPTYSTTTTSTTSSTSLVNRLIGTNNYLSDVRLKSNITRVGTHPLGIGIYEYDLFGRRERGVLAHEVEGVKPAAVTTDIFGIKRVDYGAL